MEACRAGMSQRGAAKKFAVPRSTLQDRLKERSDQRGRPPALSSQVENLVADYCTTMSEIGFGVSRGKIFFFSEKDRTFSHDHCDHLI